MALEVTRRHMAGRARGFLTAAGTTDVDLESRRGDPIRGGAPAPRDRGIICAKRGEA